MVEILSEFGKHYHVIKYFNYLLKNYRIKKLYPDKIKTCFFYFFILGHNLPLNFLFQVKLCIKTLYSSIRVTDN